MNHRIIVAVESISHLPGARVDCNFGQDSEAFAQQFSRFGREPIDDYSAYVARGKSEIAELKELVSPYILPEDYLFFLEYFGGLALQSATRRLEIMGFGPMCTEWYSGVIGENSHRRQLPFKNLDIAYLRVHCDPLDYYEWVNLNLDVMGSVKLNGVIGHGPYGSGWPMNRAETKLLAGSFTELLERIATTDGRLGYSCDEEHRKNVPSPTEPDIPF